MLHSTATSTQAPDAVSQEAVRRDDLDVSAKKLISRLACLGPETERAYERRVSAIASTTNPESLAESLRAILEDVTDPDTRYAAFYTLCTLHRNNKNYRQLDHTIQHWEHDFAARPSFTHLQLLSKIVHIGLFVLERGVSVVPMVGVSAG